MAGDNARPNRRPQFLKCVIEVLHEHGSERRGRDVLREVGRRLTPDEYERGIHEKTGYVRWEAALQLDSIRLVKAGWLRKKRGIWYLTDEGAKLQKTSADELWKRSWAEYQQWKRNQPVAPNGDDGDTDSLDSAQSTAAYERAIELARSGIEDQIHAMNPYDFQELVAALLRGMGYYTPFVAPRGKDGGVDILAYGDPFGTVAPRIKVQVKHRAENKVNVREVRELRSLLNKQGDTGLIVSTGGYTPDAVSEVRHSPMHIETLDLGKLIDMWEDHYDKLAEEDKALLPLRRIAFLAPQED